MKKLRDISQNDICNILSDILYSLPEKDEKKYFRISNPKFIKIPASFDINESIQWLKEFEESFPTDPYNPYFKFVYSYLYNNYFSPDIEEKISKAMKLINSKKIHKISRNDLLYLVRIWAYFSEKDDGINEFYRYFSQEYENILMTNPLKKG